MNNENRMVLAIAIYAAVITLIFHTLQANAQNAVASTGKILVTTPVDDDVVDFLVKSADARMMDAQGGLLASEKGTSEALRRYGQRMMEDQSMLLKQIKKLADARHVSLPQEMSNRKIGSHRDLLEESGRDFDEKFIKIMTSELERDIKLFRKAAASSDPEVSAFAQHYLPLIESHLMTISEIKAESN